MKASHLLPIIAASMAICGCWKKPCFRPAYTTFNVKDAANTFTDSAAQIIKYEAGGNFVKSTGSSTLRFKPSATLASGHSFNYEFTADGDYLITFLPSGRQHKVTKIGYGTEEHKTGLFGTRHYTICSGKYTIDGTERFQDATVSDGSVASYAIWVE